MQDMAEEIKIKKMTWDGKSWLILINIDNTR